MSDQTRYPYWFKLHRDICFSPGLLGLSAAQKWLWVLFLSECCKKKSQTIDVNITWYVNASGLSQKDILQAIDILELNNSLTVNSRSTHGGLNTDKIDKIREEEIREERSIGKGLQKNRSLKASDTASAGIREFIGAFVQAYQKRYGSKTRPELGPRVQGQIKNFLRGRDIGESIVLIQVFLQMNDPWFIKKCHDFTTFTENLQKIKLSFETGKEAGSKKPKSISEILQERDQEKAMKVW